MSTDKETFRSVFGAVTGTVQVYIGNNSRNHVGDDDDTTPPAWVYRTLPEWHAREGSCGGVRYFYLGYGDGFRSTVGELKKLGFKVPRKRSILNQYDVQLKEGQVAKRPKLIGEVDMHEPVWSKCPHCKRHAWKFPDATWKTFPGEHVD